MAVAGTRLPTAPTVLKAPVPRLTTWPGVLTRASGTPLTNLIVLAGAFLTSGAFINNFKWFNICRVFTTQINETLMLSDAM